MDQTQKTCSHNSNRRTSQGASQSPSGRVSPAAPRFLKCSAAQESIRPRLPQQVPVYARPGKGWVFQRAHPSVGQNADAALPEQEHRRSEQVIPGTSRRRTAATSGPRRRERYNSYHLTPSPKSRIRPWRTVVLSGKVAGRLPPESCPQFVGSRVKPLAALGQPLRRTPTTVFKEVTLG